MSKKEKSFEDGVKELEQVVSRLEGDDVPLDESIKLFENGMKLCNSLSARLDAAERKIEMLVKGENGEMKREPFAEEAGDGTA